MFKHIALGLLCLVASFQNTKAIDQVTPIVIQAAARAAVKYGVGIPLIAGTVYIISGRDPLGAKMASTAMALLYSFFASSIGGGILGNIAAAEKYGCIVGTLAACGICINAIMPGSYLSCKLIVGQSQGPLL